MDCLWRLVWCLQVQHTVSLRVCSASNLCRLWWCTAIPYQKRTSWRYLIWWLKRVRTRYLRVISGPGWRNSRDPTSLTNEPTRSKEMLCRWSLVVRLAVLRLNLQNFRRYIRHWLCPNQIWSSRWWPFILECGDSRKGTCKGLSSRD